MWSGGSRGARDGWLGGLTVVGLGSWGDGVVGVGLEGRGF